MAAIASMTFLQLVQALLRECRGPGATGTPTTLAGATGDIADYVNWIADSWNRLQMEKNGWRWMQASVSIDISASTRDYALATIFPVADDLARFAYWKPDTFTYYTDTGGTDTERPIAQQLWEDYIRSDYGDPASVSIPRRVIVMPDNSLRLFDTPSENATLKARYKLQPQQLSLNGDIPELPKQYHMILVWDALIDHAIGSLSQEQLVRAQERRDHLWYRLIKDELEPIKQYSRTLVR